MLVETTREKKVRPKESKTDLRVGYAVEVQEVHDGLEVSGLRDRLAGLERLDG